MALDGVLCDGELSEFLHIGRAAKQIPISNGTDELCDNIFSCYSKNCIKSDYLVQNKTDQHNVTFDNPNSLTLMHINIRLLNKNFDKFHNNLESLSFRPFLCISDPHIKNQPLSLLSLLAVILLTLALKATPKG